MTGIERDLLHFEQRVNERFGTDPAPPLPPQLLPDNGAWQPLDWAQIDARELDIFSDRDEELAGWRAALTCAPGRMLFPVHPLLVPRFASIPMQTLGRFAVSASYRTVFYEPQAGSPFAALIPPEHFMVLKLHLDEPIPGIPGDRRLTADKVRKCVALSRALPELMAGARGGRTVEVIREGVGLVYGGRGALIRFVPRHGVIPAFALFSRDSSRPGEQLILIREFERLGLTAERAAAQYGELLGRPLIRAACSAFDQGFSFELHAQNTLVSVGGPAVIERVLFRDLESVLYFPEYRLRRGYAPLPALEGNPELIPSPAGPLRWFNRNVDHDIGRILRGSLQALVRAGYFSAADCHVATRSCRRALRSVIDEYRLRDLNWPARWLRVSRAPYGRGWRRGDYYRPEFR